MAENIVAGTGIRRQEIAHILDDAEERHLDLAEHGDRLAGVDQGEILRRRDDHGAGERNLLRHSQLHVASARGHVDDEDVELSPGDLRSEEHKSELQSLMRSSYAVFCLKKKKKHTQIQQ